MSTTIDGSAGITTNAGGSVNPSTNVEGINYSCRAWVNFNGTGTVAIRGSGNVTSITDNGVGSYTVNFTTAMSDANYVTVATSGGSASRPTVTAGPYTTNAAAVNCSDSNTGVFYDQTYFNVAIFR